MTLPAPLRVPSVLLAACLAAACGGGADFRAPDGAPRDSAGVRIVESGRPLWGDASPWTVEAAPSLEIGGVEGPAEQQFGRVAGAVRLADGGIVVADANAGALRFFDATGRFLRAAGRSGGGPGEFGTLDALLPYRGDSVVAWDVRQRRLTVVGPDGGAGRTTTVQALPGASAVLRGAFPDGSLVLEPTASVEAFLRMEDGERRDSVLYLRYTAEGAPSDTLARRADRELVAMREGGVLSQQAVLFGRDSYLATGGERVYVGESDAFRVDVVDTAGRVRMSIRRPGRPRDVSREDLAQARAAAEARRRERDAQVARVSGGAARAPGFGEVPARSTVPAFDQLVADAAGNLWVRDYQPAPDAPSRWSVFDPQGRWLGHVQTPAGLVVLQIGTDWVLGRARDELEVESIRIHPLRKG